MTTPRFDLDKFAQAVHLKRWRERLTVRDLSTQVGVSPATISRMERGHIPKLDTFLILCDWLNMDLSDFVIDSEEAD